MPIQPKLETVDVLEILETEVIPYFTFVPLQPEDYLPAIRDLVGKGFGGGRICDMLHLRAASKLALERIYTFNDAEWKTLAPELSPLICSPPPMSMALE